MEPLKSIMISCLFVFENKKKTLPQIKKDNQGENKQTKNWNGSWQAMTMAKKMFFLLFCFADENCSRHKLGHTSSWGKKKRKQQQLQQQKTWRSPNIDCQGVRFILASFRFHIHNTQMMMIKSFYYDGTWPVCVCSNLNQNS